MRRRSTPSKAELVARLHRGLRPKLDRAQITNVALCHAINLDAVATGQADIALLWDWVGNVMTWCEVARRLQLGVPEMCEQLELAERMVTRYGRTGRVAFDGPDYQLAKRGLMVMDQLATIVDHPTATAAAAWSNHRIAELSQACAQMSRADTSISGGPAQ